MESEHASEKLEHTSRESERDREGQARLCSVWLRTLAKYLMGKQRKRRKRTANPEGGLGKENETLNPNPNPNT